MMLDQELADTIEAERARRRGGPAVDTDQVLPAAALPLARDLVGTPAAAPKVGVCSYCGSPAPRRTVCHAHSDLPRLDPTTVAATTTATTRSSR